MENTSVIKLNENNKQLTHLETLKQQLETRRKHYEQFKTKFFLLNPSDNKLILLSCELLLSINQEIDTLEKQIMLHENLIINYHE